MKRPDQSIELIEADGDRHPWTLKFHPLPKGESGYAAYEKRVLVVNSRLRKPSEIRATLIHEAVHVACGQVASEEVVRNVEVNILDLLDAVGM